MTILIVPSWYKTDSNPTMGSFFYEQAALLASKGIKVIVADATLQGKADYTSKRCFRLQVKDDDGVLTYSYVVPAIGLMRMQDAGSKVFFSNLKKIYKRIVADGHKIDLIHAHSYLPAGLAAVRLGEKENIPVVVTEHASDVLVKNLSDKRVNYLIQTVEKSNAFICVSEALKNAIIDLTHTDKRLYVIPNAVDRRFVSTNSSRSNTFSFISIGNLVPSKRFDLTIKAFAEAFKTCENVRLTIVGDGILRETLEEYVRQNEVEKKVSFTGRISRDQVAKTLQESNVFVLASDFETFGVVYVEALACGIPVIGTKNGGAEDIIEGCCGLLVEKNSVSALANAMKTMYLNYSRYNQTDIAEWCQKRFGADIVFEKIFEVYKTIGESDE